MLSPVRQSRYREQRTARHTKVCFYRRRFELFPSNTGSVGLDSVKSIPVILGHGIPHNATGVIGSSMVICKAMCGGVHRDWLPDRRLGMAMSDASSEHTGDGTANMVLLRTPCNGLK
jgi:hypothetical protein